MPKATRKCKVCGKEYPYCTTLRKEEFRWQDVACCPEHGRIYLARIMESRSKKKAEPKAEVKAEPVAKTAVKSEPESTQAIKVEKSAEAVEPTYFPDVPDEMISNFIVYGDIHFDDGWDNEDGQ